MLKKSDEFPKHKFEINIAGAGQEELSLKYKANAAGITELNFVGHVTNPQSFLAEHHAYIQPSRCEGLGIAAHEAMQASLPVLCSRTGQMSLTVRDNHSGWHCEPNDPACLARALKLMLETPENAEHMQSTAFNDVNLAFGVDAFEAAGQEFVARVRALL